jgi:hypothetical protein
MIFTKINIISQKHNLILYNITFKSKLLSLWKYMYGKTLKKIKQALDDLSEGWLGQKSLIWVLHFSTSLFLF